MSSGYGGEWDYAATREAAAVREQRARLAALRQQATSLRAKAAAARRLGVRASPQIDDSEPAANASSTELATWANALDAAVTAASADLDHRMNAAWLTRLGVTPSRPASTTPRESATRAYARRREAEAADRDTTSAFTRNRDQAAVAEARAMLAESLTRCDVADIEELEGLATALRDGDLAAEQALRRKLAGSIIRRAEAERAAHTRERLLSMISDALPAERAGLRAMITHAADPDQAREHVERAVARADRVRAQVSVAAATADALRELGCEVGEDFSTFLGSRGAAIAGLRDFPGYGVRVSVSESDIETLVVRRVDAAAGQDLAVQRAVCARLDPAWETLRRTGVGLSAYRRVEPGEEPVPEIGPAHWSAECPAAARSARRTDTTAATTEESRRGR
jgi:hypothetical protein